MEPEQKLSKIRIAFVSNTGYSLFHEEVHETYGGAQVDLYLLAKEFSANPRYHVSLIYLDYGQALVEQIGNIQLLKSYRPRNKRGALVWQFAVACYRLWVALRSADASIYFHEGAEFEVAVTRIFCWLKNRKYILRLASIGDVDGHYHKAYPLHNRLFTFGMSGASAIVAQTEDQRRFLEARSKSAVVIENIFPSVELPIVEKSTVIWVGRLIKIKRAEFFLRLAVAFPQDNFVLLGPVEAIDTEYAHSIQRAAKEMANVEYIEKVPFHKVSKIFGSAKLLVNTSEHEGFPMTFVQGMCNGVPILTMGVDPDQVVSRFAGFVAGDEQELRTKYSQILQPATWSSYSQSARKYAKEHFAPSIVMPKYQEVINAILSE